MNEINVNALSRSLGVEKPHSAAGQRNVAKAGNDRDSIQLSHVPDLSSVEAAIEEEFAAIRSKLQDDVQSELYPPLETIDRLAEMFALNLSSKQDPLQE